MSGSSANPWLDFLPFSEAQRLAQQLNAELESYCATSPSVTSAAEFKRLYGFGLLPLVPGAPTHSLPEAVSQLASQHPHIRGVIIGTRGAGLGLDDPALEPLWAALAETGLVVFLHPHYGVGNQTWGPLDNGHVLPLALGFPFETTTVCVLLPARRNVFLLTCSTGGCASHPCGCSRSPPEPTHPPCALGGRASTAVITSCIVYRT
jgi:aminocarboxymuconate-semialdehyde decarboxylase